MKLLYILKLLVINIKRTPSLLKITPIYFAFNLKIQSTSFYQLSTYLIISHSIKHRFINSVCEINCIHTRDESVSYCSAIGIDSTCNCIVIQQ